MEARRNGTQMAANQLYARHAAGRGRTACDRQRGAHCAIPKGGSRRHGAAQKRKRNAAAEARQPRGGFRQGTGGLCQGRRRKRRHDGGLRPLAGAGAPHEAGRGQNRNF